MIVRVYFNPVELTSWCTRTRKECTRAVIDFDKKHRPIRDCSHLLAVILYNYKSIRNKKLWKKRAGQYMLQFPYLAPKRILWDHRREVWILSQLSTSTFYKWEILNAVKPSPRTSHLFEKRKEKMKSKGGDSSFMRWRGRKNLSFPPTDTTFSYVFRSGPVGNYHGSINYVIYHH